MSYLQWITDDNLESAVFNLWVHAGISESNAKDRFNYHFVDPFIGITEMNVFQIEYDLWKRIEVTRSIQKDLIKYLTRFFLQITLTYNESDFVYSKIDQVLLSENNKIIACLNYKYKKSLKKKGKKRYIKMCKTLYQKNKNTDFDFTAFFLIMIPQKPTRFNISFSPTRKLNEINDPDQKVKITDIASFFHKITQDENALRDLFNVLPIFFAKFSDGKLMRKEHEKLLRTFYYTYG